MSLPGIALCSPPPVGSPAPPANFFVTTDAEFVTANAAATAGQIIQLQDAGVFTTLTLTNATGVTVRGQTPRVPIVRQFIINGATGAYVKDFTVQPNVAPTSAQRWVDLKASTGVTLDNLKVRCGDFLASFADYDPTFNYDTYWGTNGSWTGYAPASGNALDWAGYGIGSTSTVAGNCTIINCEVTDTNHGIKFSWSGGGALKINNNVLGRVYSDPCSVIMSIGGSAITGLEYCGNEIYDNFAQPQDNLNPHADNFQWAGNTGGGGFNQPLINAVIAGNVMWYRAGARGEPHRLFISDMKDTFPLVGAVIVDNLLVARIASQGIEIANAGTTGGVWTYARNNTVVANPSNNAIIQNEQYTNPNTGATPSSGALLASINILIDTAYPNPQNLVAENVAESVVANPGLISTNNNSLGRGSAAGSYGSNANPTTDGQWNALASGQDYLTAFQTSANFGANKGVGGRTGITSAATLRSVWANAGSRPWSSFPKWLAWTLTQNAVVSTVYTTGWAMLHIPGGGSATITPDGGTAFAIGNAITDTPSYGTSPLTINDKQLVSLQATSSASPSTTTNPGVTVGSDHFTWSLTTAANTVYPRVVFSGTERTQRTLTTGLASDGPYMTLGFKAKFPASISAQVGLFGVLTGVGAWTLTFLTTGLLRANFYNAAGTNTVRLDMTGASLFDGNEHEIFIGMDTSQAVAGNGRVIVIDGVDRTSGAGTYTSGNLGYSRSSITYFFGGVSGGSITGVEVEYFIVDLTQRLDVTNSTIRNNFVRANIGTDGSGALGRQAEIFLVGDAAQWNAGGGLNFGSTGVFVKQAGTFTDGAGAGPAWP